jgi:hypothetical protein
METQVVQDLYERFVAKVWDRYGPVVGILTAVAGVAALFSLAYLILRLFL